MSTGLTLTAIALPVVLMLVRTVAQIVWRIFPDRASIIRLVGAVLAVDHAAAHEEVTEPELQAITA